MVCAVFEGYWVWWRWVGERAERRVCYWRERRVSAGSSADRERRRGGEESVESVGVCYELRAALQSSEKSSGRWQKLDSSFAK